MIKKIFISVGEYLLFMKTVFRKPEKMRIFWRQLVNESDKLIMSSILLVGVISIFIGGVLVIQTASNLENPIIDKMYIGYMVRESLILEFQISFILNPLDAFGHIRLSHIQNLIYSFFRHLIGVTIYH